MLNQSTVYVHVDGTCIILYGRIVNQIQNIKNHSQKEYFNFRTPTMVFEIFHCS